MTEENKNMCIIDSDCDSGLYCIDGSCYDESIPFTLEPTYPIETSLPYPAVIYEPLENNQDNSLNHHSIIERKVKESVQIVEYIMDDAGSVLNSEQVQVWPNISLDSIDIETSETPLTSPSIYPSLVPLPTSTISTSEQPSMIQQVIAKDIIGMVLLVALVGITLLLTWAFILIRRR